MPVYEYKVLPAPNRPVRKKGVKGNPGRFAAALQEVINAAALDGWEYLRSDSLPVKERQGVMRNLVETYHTVLVFQREARPETVQDAAQAVGLIEDQSGVSTDTLNAEGGAEIAETQALQMPDNPAAGSDQGSTFEPTVQPPEPPQTQTPLPVTPSLGAAVPPQVVAGQPGSEHDQGAFRPVAPAPRAHRQGVAPASPAEDPEGFPQSDADRDRFPV